MKRLAYAFVTALLLELTGYLSYAYGNVKGREEAMEEVNAKRIFPGMYETLEDEHRALARRQMEALWLIDFCDSTVETLKEGTADDVQDFRMRYKLMRSRMGE